MTTKPKFVTTDGWLTAYALACGYVECAEKDQVRCELMLYKRTTTYFISTRICTNIFTHTTKSLTQARKLYSAELKKLNLKREKNYE
jgi:hypothetical protein